MVAYHPQSGGTVEERAVAALNGIAQILGMIEDHLDKMMREQQRQSQTLTAIANKR